jgi:mono/diheme cytochrome c family protein
VKQSSLAMTCLGLGGMLLLSACGDEPTTADDATYSDAAHSDAAPIDAAPAPPTPEELAARGGRIYAALCLACHQADGGGVPMMQPPIDGSAIVLGDPAPLVELILRGVGGGGIALDASGEWPQAMGGYSSLPAADVAAVTTYIRQAWGNDAGPVTAEFVAEQRAALPGS